VADQNGSGPAVVAVILTWRDRIAVLKRSAQVSSDSRRWHCITGFLERGTPMGNAVRELQEETGLAAAQLTELRSGPVLSLLGEGDQWWTVHTFAAQTSSPRLTLNWEHDNYRWVARHELRELPDQVPWLRDVVEAIALGVADSEVAARAG
jgi:8-oxo-dGTP pyrophosphatase MutT (NUDIX family)